MGAKIIPTLRYRDAATAIDFDPLMPQSSAA
jgi:hypothetical protein